MSLIEVKIIGVDGREWVIDPTGTTDSGLYLYRPKGLVSQVETSNVARPTGIGVDRAGVTFSEMEGSLELRVFPSRTKHMTLGEVYIAFVESLSTVDPFTMTVTDGRGREWTTDSAVLTKEVETPEKSPHTPGLNHLALEVPITISDGVFSRRVDYPGGNTVTVTNNGDITAHPVVTWTGYFRTATTPAGQALVLPNVKDSRTASLSTDPATGYVVVDTETGAVNVEAWSSMRGMAVPAPLRPREQGTWKLGAGVSLHVDEYCTNVWK